MSRFNASRLKKGFTNIEDGARIVMGKCEIQTLS